MQKKRYSAENINNCISIYIQNYSNKNISVKRRILDIYYLFVKYYRYSKTLNARRGKA